MKDEEKKGFRSLSNKFELENGWKLEERMIFLEKKGFGSREKREVSRCLSLNKTRLTSSIYRIRHLNRSSRYRGGVENKSSMFQDVSSRCQRLKTSMYRGRCRANKEFRNLAQWIGLCVESIKRKPKNLDKKGLCWEVSNCYRACYWASIEQHRNMKFQGRKDMIWMQIR